MLEEIRLLQAICSLHPMRPCVGVCLEGDTTLRLIATAQLYHAGRIFGAVVSGGISEPQVDKLPAGVMKQKLIEMGLPHDSIILEEQSRNTAEQAQFVNSLAEKRRISELLIIASGYHLLRAYRTFLRTVLVQSHMHCLYGYPAGSLGTWFAKTPSEKRYRFLLFFDELAKIREYENDIASAQETWDYVRTLNMKQP